MLNFQLNTTCNYRILIRLVSVLIGLPLSISDSAAGDFTYRGNIGFQAQHYTENTAQSLPPNYPVSLSAQAEMNKGLAGTDIELTVTPFLRWDSEDDERSHADIRELKVSNYSDSWEWQIGLVQVFWGVAESRNVVNVINQTDGLEGATTTEKLGAPMFHATKYLGEGSLEVFVLPYFRERGFGGSKSRPRSDVPINDDAPMFEAESENKNIDVALRYSTSFDVWDIGLSVFRGTRREPDLVFNQDANLETPFYPLMTHTGVDVQATIENWSLKTEVAYQSGRMFKNHTKLVTGFEYSFYDIKFSGIDVGLIGEYLFDGLGESPFNIFDNDVLVGARIAVNDVQSTEALLAYSIDLESSNQFFTAEVGRRVGQNYKLTFEATTFANENYIAANFQRFF